MKRIIIFTLLFCATYIPSAMATYIYADMVAETTISTGTGTINLAGAITGYRTFVAGIGDGNTCAYQIKAGSEWEIGSGTVTDDDPDTLSRDTVYESSNSGNLVNFSSGTKYVSHVFSATDMTAFSATSVTALAVGTACPDINTSGYLNTGSVDANEIVSTAVTPGSYTNTDLTVDADGRITAASSGSSGSGSTGDFSVTQAVLNSSQTLDAADLVNARYYVDGGDYMFGTAQTTYALNGGKAMFNFGTTAWSIDCQATDNFVAYYDGSIHEMSDGYSLGDYNPEEYDYLVVWPEYNGSDYYWRVEVGRGDSVEDVGP